MNAAVDAATRQGERDGGAVCCPGGKSRRGVKGKRVVKSQAGCACLLCDATVHCSPPRYACLGRITTLSHPHAHLLPPISTGTNAMHSMIMVWNIQ